MKTEVESVFLFIAELTGSFKAGSGTVETKMECGKKDYIHNHLPKLDLADEEDRKDLHEGIWLQRLYNELDEYFNIVNDSTMRYLASNGDNYREAGYKWAVPIELDASALTKCY